MTVPRLLPLIGVAVVGVLAINALGGAKDLPGMLSAARAYAEGATAPPAKGAKPDAKTSKPADPAKPAAAAPLPPGLASPAGTPPPLGICAPGAGDLAKAAGLSPAELQVLQNLQARRGQIDQQAKDIDTQTQLLSAAEAKLDVKLKAMADLKGQIEALMGQADQKTQAEVDRLVAVIGKMKADKAADLMTQLDPKVAVPVAASLKPAVLAGILDKMNAGDAKKLTELLAHRFAPVQALADAIKNPPPAQPTPPAKPDPKGAKPTQTAEAAAEPGDANVDDAGAKPAKPKPAKLAKRAPPKKKPASKKAPVEEAKATTGPKPYTEVKAPPVAKPEPAAATPAPAKT